MNIVTGKTGNSKSVQTNVATVNMDQRIKMLNRYLKNLDAQQQQSVLDFAAFLVEQNKSIDKPEIKQEPKTSPRPAKESVVAAMKRLTETYFMIETGELLHKASDLMGQHILQGKDAKTVIDDLEQMYLAQYEMYKRK